MQRCWWDCIAFHCHPFLIAQLSSHSPINCAFKRCKSQSILQQFIGTRLKWQNLERITCQVFSPGDQRIQKFNANTSQSQHCIHLLNSVHEFAKRGVVCCVRWNCLQVFKLLCGFSLCFPRSALFHHSLRQNGKFRVFPDMQLYSGSHRFGGGYKRPSIKLPVNVSHWYLLLPGVLFAQIIPRSWRDLYGIITL